MAMVLGAGSGRGAAPPNPAATAARGQRFTGMPVPAWRRSRLQRRGLGVLHGDEPIACSKFDSCMLPHTETPTTLTPGLLHRKERASFHIMEPTGWGGSPGPVLFMVRATQQPGWHPSSPSSCGGGSAPRAPAQAHVPCGSAGPPAFAQQRRAATDTNGTDTDNTVAPRRHGNMWQRPLCQTVPAVRPLTVREYRAVLHPAQGRQGSGYCPGT